MIKLDKIYTRGGDKGKTSLGLGERVSKSNKIIIAIGSIEELNAHLGIACQGLEKKYAKNSVNIYYIHKNHNFEFNQIY